MGNLHLITGYAGKDHITAADQGAFNAALIGTGKFVLDKGNVFKAQVISNNQIRVLDGELMMQGRFVRLNPYNYVDLSIDSGAQGMKRNDLIVARYIKDAVTGIEDCNLVVIKGTAVASTSKPADPAYKTGDIQTGTGMQADGSLQSDMPLWRIPLDGLNVGEPVSLFGEPFMDSMRTLPEIRQQVQNIHSEVDAQLAKQDAEIDEKIAGIDSYLKTETLTDETKVKYGLSTDAVPDDVLGLIPNLIAGRSQIAIGSYTGTGTVGSDNKNSLTFDFEPKIVFITAEGCPVTTLVKGQAVSPSWVNIPPLGGFITVDFYGKNVTWYIHGTGAWTGSSVSGLGGDSATHQLNTAGQTYYYVAIG